MSAISYTPALLAGLASIAVGGNVFVDSACAIARRLGVSRAVIGLTLVSFATTAPELVASTMAAGMGNVGLAYGNAVGTCIANIALILAIVAATAAIPIERDRLNEGAVMVGLGALVTIIAWDGTLSRYEGVGLLLILVLFLRFIVRRERRNARIARAGGQEYPAQLGRLILLFSLGALGILVGSRLLIYSGRGMAESLGVSEAVIGFTMVAVGTSLPELVTAVMSAFKRVPELSLGNIVGANILDLTWVLGLSAVIRPLSVGLQTIWFSNLMMFLIMASLLVFMRTGQRLTRGEGWALLALYAFYLTGLILLN